MPIKVHKTNGAQPQPWLQVTQPQAHKFASIFYTQLHTAYGACGSDYDQQQIHISVPQDFK